MTTELLSTNILTTDVNFSVYFSWVIEIMFILDTDGA